MSDDRLVYGMGLDPLVEPDWPPLTLDEADEVLRRFPDLNGARKLLWRSPRPLSAVALVNTSADRFVIVKRLPRSLRDPEALAEEHAFMDHLRAQGIPVPVIFRDATGASAVARGEFTYEIQEPGLGNDLYAATFSWSPYLCLEDATAAGRALAELHVAARGYDAPGRPARPLLSRFSIFSDANPVTKVESLLSRRPALREFLAGYDWRTAMTRVHLPVHRHLLPLLDGLEPLWTHNDWHGANLLWTDDRVSCVFDFGLADRTTAVHDLATAIERCAVDWISIRDGGPANVQTDQVRALLDGYESVRPLSDAERRALPELFPLVHAEYELSEIDYFLSCVPGGNHKNAEIAYEDYFLGHTEWTTKTEEGQALLGLLRETR